MTTTLIVLGEINPGQGGASKKGWLKRWGRGESAGVEDGGEDLAESETKTQSGQSRHTHNRMAQSVSSIKYY